MSYPYHMALWDRWHRQATMKKAQQERQAAAMAVMKKPEPKQFGLI